MNTFNCQCYTSGASDRFAAQKRLDDLVTGPWYTNSKEKEDAARIRHHIKILKATNAFDIAELLDIAHCCTTLQPDASSAVAGNCGTALVGALIHDTRHRLSSMERLAARIRERNDQVKKLEHHLKVYGMILRSLDVVLPGDGTTYSYKIDPRNGLSLIIQAADNSDAKSQVSSENTDLVDLAVLPCISTPVLKPVCISPPTRAPTTLAAEQDAQDVKREEPAEWVAENIKTELIASPEKRIITHSSQEEPSSPKRETPAVPQRKPKAAILQIWDSEEERDEALQEYAVRGHLHPESVPQVFQHGIQYHPTAPLAPPSRSRMVVFAGLHPATTLAALLDRVRGGPVLRAVRADRSTALVSFVHARDAHAYVAHVAPRIRGHTPRVSLADSPSYPVRGALLRDIVERGVTRVLAIPCADAAFRGALEGFFAWKGLWAFAETRGLRCETGSVVSGDGDGEDAAREGGNVSEATDEWTAVGDRISNTAEQRMPGLSTPTPTETAVYSVSFRDVQHARNACSQIRAIFPRCGVHYAPDRCAGPLDELDGWDMLA